MPGGLSWMRWGLQATVFSASAAQEGGANRGTVAAAAPLTGKGCLHEKRGYSWTGLSESVLAQAFGKRLFVRMEAT